MLQIGTNALFGKCIPDVDLDHAKGMRGEPVERGVVGREPFLKAINRVLVLKEEYGAGACGETGQFGGRGLEGVFRHDGLKRVVYDSVP